MDYDAYENLIIGLCEKGNFEKAEKEKTRIIPLLKELLRNNDETGIKILHLFSEVAGEAESFENFSNLLEELKAEDLITENHAEQLLGDSPASRWI